MFSAHSLYIFPNQETPVIKPYLYHIKRDTGTVCFPMEKASGFWNV